jgi:dTDP-4-amino-4,6-dideoxygalactose transaminase
VTGAGPTGRDVVPRYDAALAGLPGVRTPFVDPVNEHIFHQYTVRVERRDALRQHLSGRGVGCAVYYPTPLHLQPCFSALGYRPGRLPRAECAAREVLSLPVYPELAATQQDEVIAALRSFAA